MIVSGPTLTCPCSTNFTAWWNVRQTGLEANAWGKKQPTALTVSAILDITMITGSRRRQKAATVSLLSTSLSFAWELRTPMSYSFDNSCPSIFARKGS